MKMKMHEYDLNALRKQGEKLLDDIWSEKTPELYQDYKADLDRIIMEAYSIGFKEGQTQRPARARGAAK